MLQLANVKPFTRYARIPRHRLWWHLKIGIRSIEKWLASLWHILKNESGCWWGTLERGPRTLSIFNVKTERKFVRWDSLVSIYVWVLPQFLFVLQLRVSLTIHFVVGQTRASMKSAAMKERVHCKHLRIHCFARKEEKKTSKTCTSKEAFYIFS